MSTSVTSYLLKIYEVLGNMWQYLEIRGNSKKYVKVHKSRRPGVHIIN